MSCTNIVEQFETISGLKKELIHRFDSSIICIQKFIKYCSECPQDVFVQNINDINRPCIYQLSLYCPQIQKISECYTCIGMIENEQDISIDIIKKQCVSNQYKPNESKVTILLFTLLIFIFLVIYIIMLIYCLRMKKITS